MKLEILPTELAAYDGEELIFTLKAFDKCTCTIEMREVISNGSVDDLCDAIKQGVAAMKLK